MTYHHAWTHHRRDVCGLQLFDWSQLLANAWAAPRQRFAPSGARIFYYTRLALLRLGYEPALEPTVQPLPPVVVAAFLKTAPVIGDYLAAEFGRVVRALSDPLREGPQLLAAHPAPHFARLPHLLAALGEQTELSDQDALARWDACWKSLADKKLPALVLLLNHHRLLAALVARPEDSKRIALQLLNARLAEDTQSRSWRKPPSELYLYEEPLLHWFASGLLAQPWFRVLWQMPLTQASLREKLPAYFPLALIRNQSSERETLEPLT